MDPDAGFHDVEAAPRDHRLGLIEHITVDGRQLFLETTAISHSFFRPTASSVQAWHREGDTWHATPLTDKTLAARSIAAASSGDRGFLAVAFSQPVGEIPTRGAYIYTTEDGIAWDLQGMVPGSENAEVVDVAWLQDRLYVAHTAGTGDVSIDATTDGRTWSGTQQVLAPNDRGRRTMDFFLLDDRPAVFVSSTSDATMRLSVLDGSWTHRADHVSSRWAYSSTVVSDGSTLHLFASRSSGYAGIQHVRSDDGGTTWSAPTNLPGTASSFTRVQDALLIGDELTVAYAEDHRGNPHQGIPARAAISTVTSPDRGASWGTPINHFTPPSTNTFMLFPGLASLNERNGRAELVAVTEGAAHTFARYFVHSGGGYGFHTQGGGELTYIIGLETAAFAPGESCRFAIELKTTIEGHYGSKLSDVYQMRPGGGGGAPSDQRPPLDPPDTPTDPPAPPAPPGPPGGPGSEGAGAAPDAAPIWRSPIAITIGAGSVATAGVAAWFFRPS